MAPKLSLRQKQLQSRLKEVEDNVIQSRMFISSNKKEDATFTNNIKLLEQLRDKAQKMGVPYRSNKEIVSDTKKYKEDRLLRAKEAGYQDGVYDPKTKTRDYASNIDRSGNTYDMFDNPTGRKTILNNPVMDVADIAAILAGVGLGIKASIAVAKDPSLIIKYPKEIQKKIQSAFSNFKGNKKMASSPKKVGATSAVTALSKLVGSKFTDGTYNAWRNLPNSAKQALEPDLRAGKFSGTGGIGKIMEAADNFKGASKTSVNAKPLPPMPKGASSPVTRKPTRLNQAKLPEDAVKYFGDEKTANKMKKIWGNLDAGSKSGTKTFTGPNGKGFDLSASDIKQIAQAKTPNSKKTILAKYGAGALAAAGYVLGVNYLGKTGDSDFTTISGTTEDKLKEGRTRKRATPTGDDELDANARQLKNVSQRPTPLSAKDKKVVKKVKQKKKKVKSETKTEEPVVKEIDDKKIARQKIRESEAKASKEAKRDNKLKGEGERQQGQIPKKKAEKKESIKDMILKQGKRKFGNITVDSTDEGMSKFLGTKEEIRQQMEDEEMNLRKGGMPRTKVKAFGMGGTYKSPKKNYTNGINMRYGGSTKQFKGY